jgi:hypothetical protein
VECSQVTVVLTTNRCSRVWWPPPGDTGPQEDLEQRLAREGHSTLLHRLVQTPQRVAKVHD